MKRGLLILMVGLMAAGAAYACIYFVCTAPARSLEQSAKPELAWLKEEFNLSDAEFKRVSDLHAAYLPQCQEMCRKIDAQNVELQKLLADATNVSPQIEAALAEASRLRADCQTMMLRHFIQVSQTMPPEQGRRYLAWVKDKAFLPNYGMSEQH
ncbi:periplasmic heavy metal sensor [bacterium]|nr:periplasmic heavy metal sensor [bacterium]